jgi:hypothetical protein
MPLILPKTRTKVIAFDLDGVLTLPQNINHADPAGSYVYAQPNYQTKQIMLDAMEAGWVVVIYTGRREEQRKLTENWLYSNGFQYHYLIMGKAYYTYIVDDRACSLEQISQIIEGKDESV